MPDAATADPWGVAEAAPAPAQDPWGVSTGEAPTVAPAPEQKDPWEEAPPKPQVEEPLPGTMDALGLGLKAAATHAQQTQAAMAGQPLPAAPAPTPLAAPWEWHDVAQPLARALPKLAYRMAESAPTLAGGIGGTWLGAATGSLIEPGGGTAIGGLAGGTLGAAAGAAYQTLGPVFAQELQKTPQDPEGAWDRAYRQAEVSGAFSGAAWAAFPLKFFQGPVKNLAFQAFGVQPGLSVAQQAADNALAGRPITQNLNEAYVEGAAGTAVPAVGHLLAGTIMPRGVRTPPPSIEPKTAAGEWWAKNFQPELVSDKALQADPLFAKMKAASAQEKDAIINRAEQNYYKWQSVPKPERYQFLDDVETGKTFADPWQQERADTYRTLLDQANSDEAQFGSKGDYRDNYLPHIYKDPAKAQQTFANLALPQSLGPKWFQKARYYDTIQAGIQSGLELITSNPEELVTRRLLSGVDMRMRMELLNDLRGQGMAMPTAGAPKNIVEPSWRDPYPWRQVNAPNGEAWHIAPDVQPLWDNAENARSLWNQQGLAGNTFRGWMQLKNAWVPVKLALSAFHPLHVAHINVSNNITRALNEAFSPGEQSLLRRAVAIPEAMAQSVGDTFLAMPIGTPFRGKRVRESWLTPPNEQTPQQRADVKLMTEGGFTPMLSEQLRIAARRTLSDAITNGEYLRAIPAAGRRAIEVLQKPIFEQWIPNLKAAAYMREAEMLFRRRPDLLNNQVDRGVALRAIGKQIDNRFGEMFYSGLFWNKAIKEASVASFLSLGWNLGFAREFAGGLLEPVARQMMADPTPTRALIRDVTSKTTNAFVYGLTAFAVNGLMNKAMTGEDPEGYDYIFPRIGGNNPDGSPRRITNMFYTREIPMAKKNIEDRDSLIGGLAQMMYHKMMVAPFIEALTNRDYFGYQIFDPNAPGFKQAYQFGTHVMNDQLNPMSISGAERSLELSGKPHTRMDILKSVGDKDVYLPLLGFGPAPAYASKTSLQNYIGHLYGEMVAPSEKPFEQKEKMEQRKAARDQYMLARQTNDRATMAAATKKLMELGVKPTSTVKMKPGTQDIYLFSKLPTEGQAAVLKRANKDEFQRYYPRAKRETKLNKDIIGLWGHYRE